MANRKSQSEEKIIATKIINEVFSKYPAWKKSPLDLSKPMDPPALEKVDLLDKSMACLEMDPIEKSVLCGTILGDSSFSIDKGYKNARFQNRHSTVQRSWFVWKNLVILHRFTNHSGVVYTRSSGYQEGSKPAPEDAENYGKLNIASKAIPLLTSLHEIICKNNRKIIKRSWLNHMNNYFLMTVWLDDGSLTNGRQGVICFNSTPAAEQEIFVKYLSKVWGVEAKTEPASTPFLSNGQPNRVITITDQENLMRFLSIIAPVIPVREMLYKVCFVPKDQNLLQRWKTVLLTLVRPEFRQDILDYYANLEDETV